MNEKEKEAVEKVVYGLTELALGLETDKFISRGDLARMLRENADALHGILEDGTRLRQGCGGQADGTPPPKEGPGLVGVRRNDTSAMAWSMTDGLEVLCQARKVKDGEWSIEGRSRGRLFIFATVFGGKWRAVRYMEYIRNGMVSRAMRNGCKRRGAAGEPSHAEANIPQPKAVREADALAGVRGGERREGDVI